MTTMTHKAPYKILQVDLDAEPEVIAAAYRSLAKRYHPDANPRPDANERMGEINWAYEILRDPTKKAEYDRRHAVPSAAKPPEPSTSRQTQRERDSWRWSVSAEEAAERIIFANLFRQGKICMACGDIAPTREVDFEYNVGMIFMRRVHQVKGRLCRKCIEYHFWEATGISLLLGWWGYISFFVNWFYLIKNLITYLGSLGLKHPQGSVWAEAMKWKLASAAMVALVAWILSATLLPGSQVVANRAATPTVSSASVPAVAPLTTSKPASYIPTLRPTIKPLFTPTRDCEHWMNITLADKGRTLCVTGTVVSAYSDTSGPVPIFYIAFAKGGGNFYMISYNGYYNSLDGNCVRARGKIDVIGNTPVMIINDSLNYCW